MTLSCFSGSISSRIAIFHWTFPFKTLEEVLARGYTIGGAGAPINTFLNAPAGSLRRKIADKNVEPYTPTKLGRTQAIKEELLKNLFRYYSMVMFYLVRENNFNFPNRFQSSF